MFEVVSDGVAEIGDFMVLGTGDVVIVSVFLKKNRSSKQN